jgi:heat shock protein HtpX
MNTMKTTLLLAAMTGLLLVVGAALGGRSGMTFALARLVGYPDGLASALRKLHVAAAQIPMPANPSTAHLFIVNPLSGRGFASLFSTHPRLEDRIARLMSYGR